MSIDFFWCYILEQLTKKSAIMMHADIWDENWNGFGNGDTSASFGMLNIVLYKQRNIQSNKKTKIFK